MTTAGGWHEDGPGPYVHPGERGEQACTRLMANYLVVEPLEPGFAARFQAAGITSFLELGGGPGPISRILGAAGVSTVVLDLNPLEWSDVYRPVISGDLRALPVRPQAFDGVSAVNCLYFLDDPVAGIKEAYDALAPGGLFLASAPSRYHDPELAEVSPRWGQPSPFDAEEAPDFVAEVFDDIDVVTWEVIAYHLPDRDAIIDYLVAFHFPQPEAIAEQLPVPLEITKKGTDVWARRT